MQRKRWSYAQITADAERELEWYSEAAREAQNSSLMVDVYSSMALGAVAMWRRLTMGWQKEGDAQRLEAMASTVRPGMSPGPR